MENEIHIKGFNRENRPFNIVDHDDGTFSLCLTLDLLTHQKDTNSKHKLNIRVLFNREN